MYNFSKDFKITFTSIAWNMLPYFFFGALPPKLPFQLLPTSNLNVQISILHPILLKKHNFYLYISSLWTDILWKDARFIVSSYAINQNWCLRCLEPNKTILLWRILNFFLYFHSIFPSINLILNYNYLCVFCNFLLNLCMLMLGNWLYFNLEQINCFSFFFASFVVKISKIILHCSLYWLKWAQWFRIIGFL